MHTTVVPPKTGEHGFVIKHHEDDSPYKVAFYSLLVITSILALIGGVLVYTIIKLQATSSVGQAYTDAPAAVTPMPENTPLPTLAELTTVPTRAATSTPAPTEEPESTSTPTPTRIHTPSPTPTPVQKEMVASACPVGLTVPKSAYLMEGSNTAITWSIQDNITDRFVYLPRAEETGGKKVVFNLYLPGQSTGNGLAAIDVTCQPNTNKWSEQDFIEYVKKADVVTQPNIRKVSIWGKNVYIMDSVLVGGYPDTVWLMATPTKLIHIKKRIYDWTSADEVEKIFMKLSWY